MVIRLIEEQLQWFLKERKGRRYTDSTVHLLRLWYVDGLSRKEILGQTEIKEARLSRAISEFEDVIRTIAKNNALDISTIVHRPENSDNLLKYDVSREKN